MTCWVWLRRVVSWDLRYGKRNSGSNLSKIREAHRHVAATGRASFSLKSSPSYTWPLWLSPDEQMATSGVSWKRKISNDRETSGANLTRTRGPTYVSQTHLSSLRDEAKVQSAIHRRQCLIFVFSANTRVMIRTHNKKWNSLRKQ